MKLLRIIAAFATSLCLISSAQNANELLPAQEKITDANNGTAVITGHGVALPEEYVVRLVKWEDGHGDFVATDTIANGQFRFEIPVEEGMTVCSLMFDYHAFPSMSHKLYLTPGATVDIDAVDNYMYTWPLKSNVPEQDEYELYINNSKELWREYQKSEIEYDKTRNMDAFQAMDSIVRLIELRNLELLKTRPVGMVWLEKATGLALMSDRLKIDTEDLKLMYATLDDSIKNSPEGRAIYGYLYSGSPIGIGDKFPDTEFYDLDGKVHKLSEFQGKWCLVDFWNSGCSPCLRALPELRELKAKYQENIECVSLSIDSEKIWRKSSEKIPLVGCNWNEGKENYGIFRRLGTNAYPTFLVVTPNGTIKDIWIGYATGELKHKMNFNLRPKGKTEFAESNGLRSILFPQYEKNKTERVLDIDRIEISDEGTKVFFSFLYLPNNWISISPDAYISDPKGSKYPAIGSDGIVLGEHLFADNEGNGSFSITFETIPEDVNSIDFHESSSNEGWSIEGIVLKPENHYFMCNPSVKDDLRQVL